MTSGHSSGASPVGGHAKEFVGLTMCSGMGAPEVAAPWVDWRMAAEIEPFPRAVLQQRFGYRLPDDHNQGEPLLWGDMTEITPELLRARGLPLPDLIVAGTPCQAFSVAGARKGLEDARGNLTLAFVEILHDFAAARPDGKLAALWENVPGVLSDKGNAFGCFLGGIVGAMDAVIPGARPPRGKSNANWSWHKGGKIEILDENGDPTGEFEEVSPRHIPKWPREGMVEGPRARAAWCVLDSQWFGVAQRRERVFVVIDFGNCLDPAAVLLEPDRLRGDHPPRREAGQGFAIDVAPSLTSSGRGVERAAETRGQDPVVAIPAVSMCLNAGGMGRIDGESETFIPIAHSLRGEGFDASEDGTGRGTPIVPVSIAENQRGELRVSDVMAQLTCGGGKPGQGYSAVLAPIAFAHQAAGKQTSLGYSENGTCQTLSANQTPAVAIGSPWAVRRLTPRECERLQAFPDDHTLIPGWTGRASKDDIEETARWIWTDSNRARGMTWEQAIDFARHPDGPRYKALGNSMTTNVIRWIMDRMRISMEDHA